MAERGPALPRDFFIELSCELVVQRPTLPMSTRPLASEIDMADFMETDLEEKDKMVVMNSRSGSASGENVFHSEDRTGG
jgi:hypothetical protein